jgi:hypothetical protein
MDILQELTKSVSWPRTMKCLECDEKIKCSSHTNKGYHLFNLIPGYQDTIGELSVSNGFVLIASENKYG